MKKVSVIMGCLLGIQALLLYLDPFNLPIHPYTKVIVCLTVVASILYFIAIAFLDSNITVHITGGVIAATIVCQIVLDAVQIPFFTYVFFIYGSLVVFNSLMFLIVFSLFKDEAGNLTQEAKTRIH